MNSKIIKIVLLGNLLLHAPFVVAIIYGINFINELYKVKFYSVALIVGFVYWSFMIPKYRFYSINKIKNRNEYKIWKKLSIITLLFWQDKNYFTKFEYWNKQEYDSYNEAKINLLKND